MRIFKLDDMTRGWFIGDFEPVVWRTNNCEIAVKKYCAGDIEAEHIHKLAVEVTLVIMGKVKMKGEILDAGSIILLDAGESSSFECLEDAITVVYKSCSAVGDKYMAYSY